MNNNQYDIDHICSPHYYTVIFFEKPYGVFTYQYNANISLYTFVRVSFGRAIRTGCIWGSLINPKTNYQIKSILKILAPPCWDLACVAFLEFSQKYYKAPIQEVLQTAIPAGVKKGWLERGFEEEAGPTKEVQLESAGEPLALSCGQAEIVQRAKAAGFERILIFGITGSGKTRCYLEAMRYWLLQGNVLYMVPEIHLSHQVICEIERVLKCEVWTYHSQISPKKRLQVFRKAFFSEKGCVFVTTRSGVFLPFKNLKLIVIDEEHDPSYKQQEGVFRYQARDLALFRAKQFNCVCLMGSATPSPKFLNGPALPVCFELKERATGFDLPAIELYSCPEPTLEEPLDQNVLRDLRDVLRNGEQALVYLNQRGYAPRLYCKPCRSFASCPGCLTPVIYHHEDRIGLCHHCGWSKDSEGLKICSSCHGPRDPIGFGTERLASYLQDVFPLVPQYRFDSDCVKTPKQVKELLDKLHQKGPAIIIGTQMISKGHDWPYVTLAILLVGAFQLKEQLTPFLLQQLLQTAGRSGRHAPGRVIMPIVHDQMGTESLKALDHAQYVPFAKKYFKDHPEQALHSAKLFFQSCHLDMLLKELRRLVRRGGSEGPFMDYPSKRGVYWRAFILVLSQTRNQRTQVLDELELQIESSIILKKNFLSIEIDPLTLY